MSWIQGGNCEPHKARPEREEVVTRLTIERGGLFLSREGRRRNGTRARGPPEGVAPGGKIQQSATAELSN